ncbi:MAG: hypothetical protein I3273_05830 [Candidatus Moeniiplasma glomeromycotorum]|nr:hypothetical protein [Candidatus Moeniiplasma glomeromycotorum]MCE8169605.1 hypothetical protein [Candidatus Moeniiplasma glomeromycotorum]
MATWEEVFGNDEEAREKIAAWEEVGFKDPEKAQKAAEKGWEPAPEVLKDGVCYPNDPHLPAGVFYRPWEMTPGEVFEAEIKRVFPVETERTEFLELGDKFDKNVNIYKLWSLKENGYCLADIDKLEYNETHEWVEYSIIKDIKFIAFNWNKKAVKLYSPIREKIETAKLEINERWANILPNWNTTTDNLRKQLATYLLEVQGRNWQPKEFENRLAKIKDQVYREEAIKWNKKGRNWNDDLISEEARSQIFSAPVVTDWNLEFVRSILNDIQKILEWKEENIEGLEYKKLDEEIEKISDNFDGIKEEKELINKATDNLLEKAKQKLELILVFKRKLILGQLGFYQNLWKKLENGENDFEIWAWKNIFATSERAKEVAEENFKKLEALAILEDWTEKDFWKNSTILKGEEHYSTEAKNELKKQAQKLNQYQKFIIERLSDNEEERKEARSKFSDIKKELGLEEDFETLKQQFKDLHDNVRWDDLREVELMKELKNKMLNHDKKGEHEEDLKTIQLNYYKTRIRNLFSGYEKIEESKDFEPLIKSINKYRTPDGSEKGVLKGQAWKSDKGLEDEWKNFLAKKKELETKENQEKEWEKQAEFSYKSYPDWEKFVPKSLEEHEKKKSELDNFPWELDKENKLKKDAEGNITESEEHRKWRIEYRAEKEAEWKLTELLKKIEDNWNEYKDLTEKLAETTAKTEYEDIIPPYSIDGAPVAPTLTALQQIETDLLFFAQFETSETGIDSRSLAQKAFYEEKEKEIKDRHLWVLKRAYLRAYYEDGAWKEWELNDFEKNIINKMKAENIKEFYEDIKFFKEFTPILKVWMTVFPDQEKRAAWQEIAGKVDWSDETKDLLSEVKRLETVEEDGWEPEDFKDLHHDWTLDKFTHTEGGETLKWDQEFKTLGTNKPNLIKALKLEKEIDGITDPAREVENKINDLTRIPNELTTKLNDKWAIKKLTLNKSKTAEEARDRFNKAINRTNDTDLSNREFKLLLTELKGLWSLESEGNDLEKKVTEVLKTGEKEQIEKLKKEILTFACSNNIYKKIHREQAQALLVRLEKNQQVQQPDNKSPLKWVVGIGTLVILLGWVGVLIIKSIRDKSKKKLSN